MANKKTSELTAASTLSGSEIVECVQSGASKRTTAQLVANLAPLETTATIGTLVAGATSKSTPADADLLLLSDSAASNIIKKFSWAAVKAALLSFFRGYATTATAAATTTLTVTSAYSQFFTGTTTQTVLLPVASTLVAGQQFRIVNSSTGVVTINSSGANAVAVLPGGTSAILTCILTSGTTAASWDAQTYAPTALGPWFAGLANKATPIAADMIAIVDSEASNALKYCTLTNLLNVFAAKAGSSSQAFATAALTVTGNVLASAAGRFGGVGSGATGVNLGTSGVDGTTSYIAVDMVAPAGSGVFTHYSSTATYDAAFGTDTTGGFGWYKDRYAGVAGTKLLGLDTSANLTPGTNGGPSLGSTSLRWAQVWCATGAFNSSDATLKTSVRKLTANEIKAAQELANEIGIYQWLQAIELKGEDGARWHTGLTVQRAIEIMTANDLDWTRYAFIGYDKWEDVIVEHPAVAAVGASEGVAAVEAKAAWIEVALKAGEAYSFRYDQLNQFICAGQQAAIAGMEARLAKLESKGA